MIYAARRVSCTRQTVHTARRFAARYDVFAARGKYEKKPYPNGVSKQLLAGRGIRYTARRAAKGTPLPPLSRSAFPVGEATRGGARDELFTARRKYDPDTALKKGKILKKIRSFNAKNLDYLNAICYNI